jgi:hypothetical protein
MRKVTDHPVLQELVAYVDHELSSSARGRVEAHVKACMACAAQLESLLRVSAAVDEKETALSTPSRDGITRQRAVLRARLDEMAAHSGARKEAAPHWSRSLAYAAALMILMAMGGLFLQQYLKAPEHALALPNPAFTPGATRQVSLGEICAANDDEVVRTVPAATQQTVFREYGLNRARPGDFEVDYLITPGLGGSDDVANLWPQPHGSRWNSYVKDQLEDHLHHMVCRGELPLSAAQHEIAANWIAAYKKYFQTDRPLAESPSAAPVEALVQRAALLR